MTETERLYGEIKRLLKSNGLTYRHVAEYLGVSNASVKRLFAEQTLSMQRLESIAQLLGMTILEIMKSAESREVPIDMLSEEQELALVSDLRLLLVGTCVTNRWSFEKILAHYQLTEPEIIKLMVQLDRLGIIELLPGNRYRLFVSRNFRWRNNGPLQSFFFQTVLNDFFSPNQNEDKSYYRFIWGLTARSEIEDIRQKIDKLASEYVTLTEETPYSSEKHGSILLISFRHDWQPPQFRNVKRPATE